MVLAVAGDENPRVIAARVFGVQPVADVERSAAVLIEPLQVAQRADVGGQNGTDGHRRFFDAAVHQVRRVRTLQKRAQVRQADGHQLFQQLADAAVLFTGHAPRGGHKQRAGRQHPERIAAAATVGQQGGREVLKVTHRLALFPQVPERAAQVERVEDFVFVLPVKGGNEVVPFVVHDDAIAALAQLAQQVVQGGTLARPDGAVEAEILHLRVFQDVQTADAERRHHASLFKQAVHNRRARRQNAAAGEFALALLCALTTQKPGNAENGGNKAECRNAPAVKCGVFNAFAHLHEIRIVHHLLSSVLKRHHFAVGPFKVKGPAAFRISAREFRQRHDKPLDQPVGAAVNELLQREAQQHPAEKYQCRKQHDPVGGDIHDLHKHADHVFHHLTALGKVAGVEAHGKSFMWKQRQGRRAAGRRKPGRLLRGV